ncbi:MAG: DNA polymerase III subunit [Candidatus Aadella gelida]|nr:DNA polymerase III subunit [Candidatus Aadella gelida]
MSLLGNIKGQDNAVRYLSNSLSSGRLSKSYLFSGPEGVGRALCAKTFIKALVCKNTLSSGEGCSLCPACVKIENNAHSDITWIKPEKNKSIKIEQIRTAREALGLKPFESPLGICVIEDAHCMTIPAGNALLKVLEEPQESSVLILITSKRELLLNTIISRCSEVRFNSLSVELAKDIIMREMGHLREEEAQFLAYFSQGSPGKALEIIEEGIEEKKENIIALLESILEENSPGKRDWMNDDKDNILEDIDILIMLLRDTVLSGEHLENLMIDKDFMGSELCGRLKKYGADGIYDMVGELIEMRKALMSNINPKIVAQVLPGVFDRL